MMKSNQSIKSKIISIGNKINKITIYEDEDIFILETILEQFIPFFREINEIISEYDMNKNSKLIQDLIMFINNLNNPLNKNKKKKMILNVDNNIKYEEKEFLYKTYISSSDKNFGSFKFFNLDTLKLNTITNQMVRGLLILLKEELTNFRNTNSNVLLEKLKKVKKLIITESKAFDYKILHILLNYIVLKYCVNLEEINFEGIFYSRIDQIDIMIKNGVYLNFLHQSKKITKLTTNNKIEFINENVAFKHMHEYCFKNNVKDLEIDKVEFNKINIFEILTHKTNLNSLTIKKINIDKNSFINSINLILQNNKNLQVVTIEKFISMPDNFKMEMISALINLTKLEDFKISIISSNKKDLNFLQLPKINSKIKKFKIKLSRIGLDNNENDNNLIDSYFNFKNTNLQKLSFQSEKFSLGNENACSSEISVNLNLINFLPMNLRELSLGLIDHIFLEKFTQLSPEYLLKLNMLKFSFTQIEDENYNSVYKNIIYLLQKCKMIKKFQFNNFLINYKHKCDDEIKNILKENSIVKKLVIRADIPFYVQYLDGLYYYDYPKYLIDLLFFSMKKNKFLSKIYHKKYIMVNIIKFYRIKKEKVIIISYKV